MFQFKVSGAGILNGYKCGISPDYSCRLSSFEKLPRNC
ncbi:hypothetical protein BQ1740_3927 [Bacillus subtilis]|nr:hypothetical protein BQ1740_3927 [Bacillus subtilis]